MKGGNRVSPSPWPFTVRLALVALAMQLNLGAQTACHQRGSVVAEQAIDSFEYTRPFTEVWPETVELLKARGFPLKDTTAPENGQTRETETRDPILITSLDSVEAVRVQYARIDAKRYRLQLFSVHYKIPDGGPRTQSFVGRARGLEWELVQKVEPARAAPIRERAASSQKSRDAEERAATGGVAAGCMACGKCTEMTR